MPTINDSTLLHAVSSLGGNDETSLVRRIAQKQQAEMDALETENNRLRQELAATDQQRDEWMRRAMLAECRLRTAEADHQGERDAMERALWRGREVAEVGRVACGGKGVG